MRWWKILGLAGLAGVAATGAVSVRDERRRRAYAPEEIRARLHERVAAIPGAEPVAVATTGTTTGTTTGGDGSAGAEDLAQVPTGRVRRLRSAMAGRWRRLRPAGAADRRDRPTA
ncbi:MAG TPA: hypothetical protein VEZ42_19435 [Pseudonocardia sp.]|nr:hypothetical protein [Pseudonocardia sp.]